MGSGARNVGARKAQKRSRISKINSFFSVLAEFIINSVDYKFK